MKGDLHTAFISIGSNLGDKLENCRSAVTALGNIEQTTVTALSRYYRTAPVDYLHQDWFVNAAAMLETRLAPLDLLAELKGIQHRAGRRRDPIRFGPRIIDLDIIFYDQAVIEAPDLKVPHPRMHKRRFVLQTICDIDPEIVHPVLKRNIRTLLEQLPDDDQSVVPLCCDC